MRRNVLPCSLFVGLDGVSEDKLEIRGRGARERVLGHSVTVGRWFESKEEKKVEDL